MICKLCNSTFENKSQLACHVRWHHNKNKNIVKCIFCNDEFQTANISQHESGCRKNPKNVRYCLECKNETTSKFCSKSCAAKYNNRSGKTGFAYLKSEGLHPMLENPTYKTTLHRRICFKYWDIKCALCEWNKCIDVHHIDGNHQNNNPKNLIPLCQNHHTLSRIKKYKPSLDKQINEIVSFKNYTDKIGC